MAADIIDVMGEVLIIARKVTTPFGGIRNVKFGVRDLTKFSEWKAQVAYTDADTGGALPGAGAGKIFQWWELTKGPGTWAPENLGEDILTDSIQLEGWFNWRGSAFGGTRTFDPGGPDETTEDANSEMIWAGIVDALVQELGKTENYQLTDDNPKIEVRADTGIDNRILVKGEAMMHNSVITLSGLERRFSA